MRTDAPDIVENEHVDPEHVDEKEKAALRAETDASLAKQAAASKKQAAHCRGGLGRDGRRTEKPGRNGDQQGRDD